MQILNHDWVELACAVLGSIKINLMSASNRRDSRHVEVVSIKLLSRGIPITLSLVVCFQTLEVLFLFFIFFFARWNNLFLISDVAEVFFFFEDSSRQQF